MCFKMQLRAIIAVAYTTERRCKVIMICCDRFLGGNAGKVAWVKMESTKHLQSRESKTFAHSQLLELGRFDSLILTASCSLFWISFFSFLRICLIFLDLKTISNTVWKCEVGEDVKMEPNVEESEDSANGNFLNNLFPFSFSSCLCCDLL